MATTELINAQTLFTLGGASLAVTLAGNVANHVINWNPRWFGLAIAMGLAACGAIYTDSHLWVNWAVALFQGLQIYATAVGIAGMTAAKAAGDQNRNVYLQSNNFWKPWF